MVKCLPVSSLLTLNFVIYSCYNLNLTGSKSYNCPGTKFPRTFEIWTMFNTAQTAFNNSTPFGHDHPQDPGADSGGEGKSKRTGKYGTKKSKERLPVPNGRHRSPFLLGRKTQKFSGTNQKPERLRQFGTGKTLFPGALLAVLYFSSCHIFPPV